MCNTHFTLEFSLILFLDTHNKRTPYFPLPENYSMSVYILKLKFSQRKSRYERKTERERTGERERISAVQWANVKLVPFALDSKMGSIFKRQPDRGSCPRPAATYLPLSLSYSPSLPANVGPKWLWALMPSRVS